MERSKINEARRGFRLKVYRLHYVDRHLRMRAQGGETIALTLSLISLTLVLLVYAYILRMLGAK